MPFGVENLDRIPLPLTHTYKHMFLFQHNTHTHILLRLGANTRQSTKSREVPYPSHVVSTQKCLDSVTQDVRSLLTQAYNHTPDNTTHFFLYTTHNHHPRLGANTRQSTKSREVPYPSHVVSTQICLVLVKQDVRSLLTQARHSHTQHHTIQPLAQV